MDVCIVVKGVPPDNNEYLEIIYDLTGMDKMNETALEQYLKETYKERFVRIFGIEE